MRGEARLVPDLAYAPPVPPIPPRPPIADNSAPQQLPDAGQPDTRDDAAPSRRRAVSRRSLNERRSLIRRSQFPIQRGASAAARAVA